MHAIYVWSVPDYVKHTILHTETVETRRIVKLCSYISDAVYAECNNSTDSWAMEQCDAAAND